MWFGYVSLLALLSTTVVAQNTTHRCHDMEDIKGINATSIPKYVDGVDLTMRPWGQTSNVMHQLGFEAIVTETPEQDYKPWMHFKMRTLKDYYRNASLPLPYGGCFQFFSLGQQDPDEENQSCLNQACRDALRKQYQEHAVGVARNIKNDNLTKVPVRACAPVLEPPRECKGFTKEGNWGDSAGTSLEFNEIFRGCTSNNNSANHIDLLGSSLGSANVSPAAAYDRAVSSGTPYVVMFFSNSSIQGGDVEPWGDARVDCLVPNQIAEGNRGYKSGGVRTVKPDGAMAVGLTMLALLALLGSI